MENLVVFSSPGNPLANPEVRLGEEFAALVRLDPLHDFGDRLRLTAGDAVAMRERPQRELVANPVGRFAGGARVESGPADVQRTRSVRIA
ncbi:MAG: hypothetical protein M5U08_11305 [Burkholderiales bacterium]|nr:hypothetical protein [Burkholderiales bacterium]